MYNEISVCVNDLESRPEAVIAACKYAQRFNGVVTAVYIKLDSIQITRWQGTSPMELANQLLVDLDRRESDAKDKFDALCNQYECEKIWRTVSEIDEPIKQMLCTDLIFSNQPHKSDSNYSDNQAFLNKLILETKRPVIVIPHGWKDDPFGSKILLGWNTSAEAMRAVSDSLPLMQISKKVIVLDILTGRIQNDESDGIYHIKDYLNRKKINYQLIIDSCDKASQIPSHFLERAGSENTDLIVVGGYGHSRIREIIMGGVTEYLIKNTTIPVLFSH